MNFPLQRKSSWPKQVAIVVSESPNVHMLLRELMRGYGWTVLDSTPDVNIAANLIRNGQAYMIITDDTVQMPAARQVRYLLNDPVTLCTPILAFLLESHKNETAVIQKLARVTVVDKPLTPSKFVPGFVGLVKMWEREPLMTLRRATYLALSGNEPASIKMLSKLSEIPAIGAQCAQALSHYHRRDGRIKEAETLLLSALKKAPRDLSVIVALADLYMSAGMPKLAHRLLISCRGSFPNTMAIMPDLVQAGILMGRLDDAIQSLYIMLRAGFSEDEVASYLARLLFAEGREAEAEKVLNNNKNSFKRILSTWQQAEAVPVGQAAG